MPIVPGPDFPADIVVSICLLVLWLGCGKTGAKIISSGFLDEFLSQSGFLNDPSVIEYYRL